MSFLIHLNDHFKLLFGMVHYTAALEIGGHEHVADDVHSPKVLLETVFRAEELQTSPEKLAGERVCRRPLVLAIVQIGRGTAPRRL